MTNPFLIFLFIAAAVFAEDVKRRGPEPDPIAGAELMARTVLYNERDIVPVMRTCGLRR
jgi:hypothetical protein